MSLDKVNVVVSNHKGVATTDHVVFEVTTPKKKQKNKN